MTGILGSGDPAFYHSESDAAEAERELQIRYDDSFNKDGTRNCYWCEVPFDPATMSDYERDGYVWKVCQADKGLGDAKEMLFVKVFSPSPSDVVSHPKVNGGIPIHLAGLEGKTLRFVIEYESAPIVSTNALGEANG